MPVGLAAVLTWHRKLITYISEELSSPKLNYSTYDKEFYTIVKALNH